LEKPNYPLFFSPLAGIKIGSLGLKSPPTPKEEVLGEDLLGEDIKGFFN